jgi:acyl-CoA thioesterase FadM
MPAYHRCAACDINAAGVAAHPLEYGHRLKIAYEIYDIVTGNSVTKAQTVQLAVTPGGGTL